MGTVGILTYSHRIVISANKLTIQDRQVTEAIWVANSPHPPSPRLTRRPSSSDSKPSSLRIESTMTSLKSAASTRRPPAASTRPSVNLRGCPSLCWRNGNPLPLRTPRIGGLTLDAVFINGSDTNHPQTCTDCFQRKQPQDHHDP